LGWEATPRSVRFASSLLRIASIKAHFRPLTATGHFPPAGGWIETLWQIGPWRACRGPVPLMKLLIGDGRDASVIDLPLADPAE